MFLLQTTALWLNRLLVLLQPEVQVQHLLNRLHLLQANPPRQQLQRVQPQLQVRAPQQPAAAIVNGALCLFQNRDINGRLSTISAQVAVPVRHHQLSRHILVKPQPQIALRIVYADCHSLAI